MYIPTTYTGLLRKLDSNKIEIMKFENEVFLFKKGRGSFTEMEDIEDARHAIEALLSDNRIIKEKLKEFEDEEITKGDEDYHEAKDMGLI